MRILEKSFDRKGFRYEQVYRKDNRAIYTQTIPDVGSLAYSFHSRTYEVIVIKSHNGYEIAGTQILPSEVYPSSNQWGDTGWTYQTLEEAQNKIKQLEAII